MEETYGCNLINTKNDRRQVKEFVGKYHVHVLVRQGQMTFSDGKNSFTSRQGDLAIWQMSNTIQRVECSDDFEADVLLLSGQFLQQFNPEMVWASKGFVFIRINPTFHLEEEALRLMDDDFELSVDGRFRIQTRNIRSCDADIHLRLVDGVPTRTFTNGYFGQYSSDIPAIPCTGSAKCQDRARSGLLCRSALHHSEVSLTGQSHHYGTASIRVDTVLCFI